MLLASLSAQQMLGTVDQKQGYSNLAAIKLHKSDII